MSDDLSIPNTGYRGNRAGRYGTGPSRGRRGMDPDTSRLMMFAGGLGAVLLVLIGASALIGHHSGGVPVINAEAGPIRVKPANPGGMKIDGAENDVFSGGSDTANARLAAAPESPDTAALRADAAPIPAKSPPVATPVPPAERPAIIASAPPVLRPTPRPIPAPDKSVTAPRTAPAESHAAAGHRMMVQLAALTSEEAAHAEWQQLVKKMPDLLGGRQPSFARIERDGHIFWRVRTSGFADLAQARGFCERVRAKGAGCSVADF